MPSDFESLPTIGKLFEDIAALLHKHVGLPSKDCAILAYWAIATWFPDNLLFFPSVVVSVPATTADALLRTLTAVCRRPVLLGELSPATVRRLPIDKIRPTLLIRESQLSRHTSAMLNASNQPGYLFLAGNTFQQLYCPKCIYVGESLNDSAALSNSVVIHLDGILTGYPGLPADEEITSFQNRLLHYRFLNRDKVAAGNFRVSGFQPEITLVANVLAAAIVDDVELQRGIIEVLKERDEQSRIDRASGLSGVVLRAVLFHSHQKGRQEVFVHEIAATVNRFYGEEGESLKVSNEKVGHALKRLGLYGRRLGSAGRGLTFDKSLQAETHRLGQAYDVLAFAAECTYCHELQASQSEAVVQGV